MPPRRVQGHPVGALLLTLALVGCHAPVGPRAAVGVGRAVTLYAAEDGDASGAALVDDRRWLEVPADGWLWLDDVAAELDLATVTLTSVAAPGTLTVAACRRGGAEVGLAAGLVGRQVEATLVDGAVVAGEVTGAGPHIAVHRSGRADADADGDAVAARRLTLTTADGLQRELAVDQVVAVRVIAPGAAGLGCRVVSRRPGRQLVRVSYGVDGTRWRAAYRLGLPAGDTDGEVALAVVPRFTVVAPRLSWSDPVELILAFGVPGHGRAPDVVWRGTARLDGTPLVVPGPALTRTGTSRWVYRGMVAPTGAVTDDAWGTSSTGRVVRELTLPIAATDPPGRVVGDGAAAGDAQVSASRQAATVRVAGATSHDLVGFRRKRLLVRDGGFVADEVVYSVANRGAAPLTVVIDEPLRAAAVTIRFERPAHAGRLVDDHWQRVVEVPAGGMVQGAVVFEYRRLK